jgi:hypothetical protein
LLSDLFLAERAVVVLLEPLLDAFRVKVVFFVARKRNDIVS